MEHEKEEITKSPTLAEGYRTESGRSLMDADPHEYILKPNGSYDFGEITEAIVRKIKEQSGEIMKPGMIRLHVGDDKEGIIHAKNHEEQVQSMGYTSIEEMIGDVASNFDALYLQTPREPEDNTTYVLVKFAHDQKKHQVVPIYFELEKGAAGNSYTVLTAIPMRDRSLRQKIKKDRLIYSNPAIDVAIVSSHDAVSIRDGYTRPVLRESMPTSDQSSDLDAYIVPQQPKKDKTSVRGYDAAIQGEPDYREQLFGIRERIEELGRETQSQFPEEFVRCLSASEEFFAALDDLRDEAATQSHDIGDQILAASHTAAEEMYYSIKLAPTKVRAHLDRCAHDAVRDVLSAVADSFAYHTMAVEHRRAEILKAEDHTKYAVQETKEQREEKTR